MQKKKADLIEYALLIGIFISINILAAHFFFRLDLTEDDRYSLSPAGKDLMSTIDDKLIVKVYLSGELDPAYERLRKAVAEKLDELKAYSTEGIDVSFIDPTAESNPDLQNRLAQQLKAAGIKPVVYLSQAGGSKKQVTVFPGAIISYKERDWAVNFKTGSSIAAQDQQINQSIENLEYEFLSAIGKLTEKEFKSIGIVDGHEELSKEEIMDITNTLNETYATERILLTPDQNLSRFTTLLLANPKRPWNESEKYLLDQYVMNGGSLLCFIDGTDVRRDSLQSGMTFSLVRELNLEDQFFRYGARINRDLVQDLKCAAVPVKTGLNGEVQMLEFPYFPILFNFSEHPIVRNLDAIQSKFASSIDTVKADGIKKTPLLFSSQNSRTVGAPSQIEMNSLKNDLNPETLNKSNIPMGWLLEGSFTSLYKNRNAPITIPGKTFVGNGKPAKIILISDGDIIRNDFDKRNNKALPLGYNQELQYQFSNKEFIQNCVNYLMNENIIRARSKEIKLRPLDKLQIREDRLYWQILNVVMPVLLIIAFGMTWYYLRKKRFEK